MYFMNDINVIIFCKLHRKLCKLRIILHMIKLIYVVLIINCIILNIIIHYDYTKFKGYILSIYKYIL